MVNILTIEIHPQSDKGWIGKESPPLHLAISLLETPGFFARILLSSTSHQFSSSREPYNSQAGFTDPSRVGCKFAFLLIFSWNALSEAFWTIASSLPSDLI